MKVSRVLGVVGFAIALGVTATGCSSTPAYTGPAVVTHKEVDVDKKKKKSSTTGKTKTTTETEYELTLKLGNSGATLEADVPKEKYDSIQVNQTVQVVNGEVK